MHPFPAVKILLTQFLCSSLAYPYMFIFLDESGTFTHSPARDSWCVVAAYVTPEHLRRKVDALMFRVRRIGNNGAETKLKHLSDEQYVWFLAQLNKLGGVAFAVAVDVGLHRPSEIERHRNGQADKIIEHREKMIHEAARQGLTDLSDLIRSLPVQLYTQLSCQLKLFHKILTAATLYFVQRHPPALGHFRWRLDQKAGVPTAYEDAFRKVLPAILQTMSHDEPMIMLEGENYSHFQRFKYPKGNEPTYLRDHYGIETRGGDVTNIGQVVREDFELVDSAGCAGVQVADLLSSGLRRLLRGGFSNPETVARLLGSNMVQDVRDRVPVMLSSLDETADVSGSVERLLRIISASTRPMLTQ